MPFEFSASRAVAVLVGIESYRTGEDMDLNGPVEDIIRVAKFLKLKGVLPENIHAFTQSLPRNAEEDEQALKGLGIRLYDAQEHTIWNFITDTLPNVPADNLFFYWSGHGFADEHRKQYLYTSDATVSKWQNVDFGELREALYSETYSSLLKQVFVIDCCADFAVNPLKTFPAHAIPKGRNLTHINQFVLYAAAPGFEAFSFKEKRAAVMTDELLPMLEEDVSWPMNMEHISRKLRARFEKLRKCSHLPQIPTTFSIRDWHQGEEVYRGKPAETSFVPGGFELFHTELRIDETTLPASLWQPLRDALVPTTLKDEAVLAQVVKALPQRISGRRSSEDTDIKIKIWELWQLCSEDRSLHLLVHQISRHCDKASVLLVKNAFDLALTEVELNTSSCSGFYAGLSDFVHRLEQSTECVAKRARWLERISHLFCDASSPALKDGPLRNSLLELIKLSPQQDDAHVFLVYAYGLVGELCTGWDLKVGLHFLDVVAEGRGLDQAEIERMKGIAESLRSGRYQELSSNLSSNKPVWLLMVEKAKGQALFTLSLWKWFPWTQETAKQAPRLPGTSSFGWAESLEERVDVPENEVRQVATELIQEQVPLDADKPCLEIMVPLDLLHLDFDQIKIEVEDFFEVRTSLLGVEANVALRSLERADPKHYAKHLELWKRRSKNLKVRQLEPLLMSRAESNVRKFFKNVPPEKNVFLVVKDGYYPKSSYQTLLHAVFHSGIPVSLWLREIADASKILSEAQAEVKMSELISQISSANFQEKIRNCRDDAATCTDVPHPGHSLTLLWEDPSRLWPDAAQSKAGNPTGSPLGHIATE